MFLHRPTKNILLLQKDLVEENNSDGQSFWILTFLNSFRFLPCSCIEKYLSEQNRFSPKGFLPYSFVYLVNKHQITEVRFHCLLSSRGINIIEYEKKIWDCLKSIRPTFVSQRCVIFRHSAGGILESSHHFFEQRAPIGVSIN